MPYILKQDRNRDTKAHPKNPGQLNWIISEAVAYYIKGHGLNYQTINDVVGALECAKQEFYRRLAVPYENRKIIDNGDVY